MINVKFRPENVTLFDPMPEFARDSKPARAPRYQPLFPDEQDLPTTAMVAQAIEASEGAYLRAAQQATLVDPAHVRLQNRLFKSLRRQYGEGAVLREKDFVDLRLTVGQHVTFFEIKTDTTAKRCVRNALGQLFEYSAFPAGSRADKWVIVGDAPATTLDIKYLQHLRTTFKIPTFYAKFDWESDSLAPLV
jgi:hypothetical protein